MWPSEECTGISCGVAVGLPAVRLLFLFQLLGCENILVFVVSQEKTENLVRAFEHLGLCPLNFINFVRSECIGVSSPPLKW